MENHKKSFVLYADLIYDIEGMDNGDLGDLFKAILRYVNNEDVEVKDTWKDLYEKIIAGIEYEWSKYNPVTKKYHWNYQGGITPINRSIRNSPAMNLWRIKVFERDGYTCRGCGIIGGELNAHHIQEFSKYPELRFEVSNGVTLCKSCHIKVHKRRSTYADKNVKRLDTI